jgi:tripartite ATP-independent transporter DctM subunit
MRVALPIAGFLAVLTGILFFGFDVRPFTLLLVDLLVLGFITGVPIFAEILLFAALGAYAGASETHPFSDNFKIQMADIFKIGTGEEAQVMSTIPLFILAGYILSESKTADRMVRFANALMGWMPGGLAVVTILACAIFTTFTGASGVTIVALGGLVMPSLLKQNYPERFSLGLVGGTGSVGLLFPPALPIFVYGTVYGFVYKFINELAQKEGRQLETWDTMDRFMFAGIVPGLLLITLLSLFAIVIAVLRKVPRTKFNLKELGRAFVAGFPELMMPFVIIYLITKLQIPEVASVTVLYVLALAMLVYRDVKPTAMWRIVRESMALVGAIFIIIFAANALTNYFITADVPGWLVRNLVDAIGLEDANGDGRPDQWWKFLLLLNLLLLFVGMIMDIFSAIVVVLPLVAFPAYKYGIDPYHLGVIFLLNLEIGYLTPPVGLNLYITSFKFKKPVIEVTRSILPFMGIMLVTLMLVTFLPAMDIGPFKFKQGLVLVPPERKGTISELKFMVQSAHHAQMSVKEITMPDGNVRKLTDCDKMVAEAKEKCVGYFFEVTQCRVKGGAEAPACEAEVIQRLVDSEAADNVDLDDLLKPIDEGVDAGAAAPAPPETPQP